MDEGLHHWAPFSDQYRLWYYPYRRDTGTLSGRNWTAMERQLQDLRSQIPPWETYSERWLWCSGLTPSLSVRCLAFGSSIACCSSLLTFTQGERSHVIFNPRRYCWWDDEDDPNELFPLAAQIYETQTNESLLLVICCCRGDQKPHNKFVMEENPHQWTWLQMKHETVDRWWPTLFRWWRN